MFTFQSNIEVARHVRNSKSGNMTSSGETGFNVRTQKFQIGQQVAGEVRVLSWLVQNDEGHSGLQTTI